MSTTVSLYVSKNINYVDRPVPDEEQVLAFANAVREAGGGAPLTALLPSVQSNAQTCLVARALNFKSSVMPTVETRPDGTTVWAMFFPNDLPYEKVVAIGEATGCQIKRRPDPEVGNGEKVWSLTLPDEIRNAAIAFDRGLAFQNYRESYAPSSVVAPAKPYFQQDYKTSSTNLW